MRLLISVILICLSTVFLPGCGGGSAMNPEDVVVGNTIPDFSLKSLDGKTVDRDSLKGNVVVLNFWATWCAPCMSEIPELKEVAAKSQAKVVGIALDESGLAAIKPFVESNGINYTVLLGSQDIFQQFNGVGIPYTLVLDRSQHIVKIYRGPVNKESLEETLKAIG
ncbi:MAG: TlpA family protein disulfide reductase [Acidobacteria bacterium]|nr:TlpA family protein disulfide reductase [Acidobacteriota bacterium]